MVTTIRDSRCYLQFSGEGASIFDHQNKQTEHDLESWYPLVNWLNSKDSQNLKQK